MKLTNDLVKKVGSDKLLHFLIAGWATQIGTLMCWQMALFIGLLIIGLNYFKEVRWDDKADMKDLYAAIAGVAIAFVLQFIL